VYGLAHITSLWLQGILIGLLWCCGVPLCTVAATRLGARDPGAVVLDEILALPVAYFGVELHSPAVLVAGFLLFRLFDVVKPPPARQLERLPRGLGIMADDLVAALYALLSLRLLALAGVL
jgi:phosphatidylglycerophosphatase A